MKKSFIFIAMTLILHPFIVKGQIIVVEPKNNSYFIIQNIVEGDTIVVDSIPSGLSGNIEKIVTQQGFIYKYSCGSGFKKYFGEFFTLQKYSIDEGRLKLFATSTICTYEHEKLFESGMQIEFKDNGIEFRLPAEFYGGIILPLDFYVDQKQLDCFLKFLSKSIVKL